MRAVNLLPRDEAKSRRSLPSPWVMLAATAPVVVGSLVYLGYSGEHSKVVDKRAELAAVTLQIEKLNAAKSRLQAQSDLVGLRTTRQTALQDALSKSVPWHVGLAELARVLPKGVSLVNLSVQSPTPASISAAPGAAAAPASPTAGFTIQGTAKTTDQVAQMLERLSLLPMLTDVTLGSTSTELVDKGPSQISFQVSATISAPATAGAS